jgi:hypothetical protein
MSLGCERCLGAASLAPRQRVPELTIHQDDQWTITLPPLENSSMEALTGAVPRNHGSPFGERHIWPLDKVSAMGARWNTCARSSAYTQEWYVEVSGKARHARGTGKLRHLRDAPGTLCLME